MSVIDQSVIEGLKHLSEQTGKDLLSQLVTLYLESTPPLFEEMHKCLEEERYEDLSREAHSLKSSSANIGVASVRDTAKELEYLFVDADHPPEKEVILALIQKLEEEFPAAAQELKGCV